MRAVNQGLQFRAGLPPRASKRPDSLSICRSSGCGNLSHLAGSWLNHFRSSVLRATSLIQLDPTRSLLHSCGHNVRSAVKYRRSCSRTHTSASDGSCPTPFMPISIPLLGVRRPYCAWAGRGSHDTISNTRTIRLIVLTVTHSLSSATYPQWS
jgi:hypothetical protein